TVGLWFELEDFVPASLERGQHYMGGIHAVEHAAIGLFPLVALCDRNDVGGISYPRHPEIGKGAIFIYDGYPGGVGLAKAGFEALEDLLARSLDTVASCDCEEGCPSCIYSPKCGSGNKPLDKAACVRVLEVLLGRRAPAGMGKAPEPENSPLDDPPGEVRPPERRLMVFDLETKRSADEVGGWNMAHLMGVSLGVVYDSVEDTHFVYPEKDMAGLVERLERADLIIGFNHLRFDYQVLSAYTTRSLKSRANLDLLQEIYRVLGRRVSLDHLGRATLGRSKTADGLKALEWYKQGRLDLIEGYCRDDVKLTWDLFCFARDKGYLVYEDKGGQKLRIPLALDLEKLVRK
ncbi:MAG: Zn-binding domain-containing protein, partial [Thermodesulfobacteriota bacterium]